MPTTLPFQSPMSFHADLRRHSQSPSRSVFALVVAAHALAVGALLTMKSVHAPSMKDPLSVTIYDFADSVKTKSEPPKSLAKPIVQPLSIVTESNPDIVAVVTPVIAPSSLPDASNSLSPAPTRIATTPPASEPRFDADYLNNPAPTYPPVSKKRLEQGVAILRVHVSTDGQPVEVLLHRSSGFDALDEAALKSVRRWKFIPARQADMIVAAWVLVPVAFSLKA